MILRRASPFGSARGLAIEKLETALDTAPFGGTTLFQMSCRVTSRECVAVHPPSEQRASASHTVVRLVGGQAISCDVAVWHQK